MNKKWFKNYLGNVEKNIPNKLQNTAVEAHLFGTVFKGVDLANEPLISIIGKVFRNAQEGVGEFAKLSESKQSQMLYEIQDNLRRLKDNPLCPLSEEKMLEMERFVNIMQYGYKMNGDQIGGIPQFRADMLEALINPSKFKNADGSFKDYYHELTRCLDDKNLEQITDVTSALSKMKNISKDSSLNDVAKVLGDIMGDESISKIDFDNFDNSVQELLKKIGSDGAPLEMPKDLFNSFSQFLGKDELKTIKYNITGEGLVKIEAADAAKMLKSAANRIKNGNAKDVFNMLPEMYRDPKLALNKLKKITEDSTDEQFSALAERMNFKSMDRKTCLEIIPKLEKMLENLPKEELDKIMTTLTKEMSEHPDELMKLALEGKLYKLFVTPGMEKALIAVGVSWFALNILLTYAVEQWLADMQLKAGRLGVMKAMHSLDDPAYYANIEFDQSKTSQVVYPQDSAKVSEPSKTQEPLPAATTSTLATSPTSSPMAQQIPTVTPATENSENLLSKFKK